MTLILWAAGLTYFAASVDIARRAWLVSGKYSVPFKGRIFGGLLAFTSWPVIGYFRLCDDFDLEEDV